MSQIFLLARDWSIYKRQVTEYAPAKKKSKIWKKKSKKKSENPSGIPQFSEDPGCGKKIFEG